MNAAHVVVVVVIDHDMAGGGGAAHHVIGREQAASRHLSSCKRHHVLAGHAVAPPLCAGRDADVFSNPNSRMLSASSSLSK